MSTPEVKAKRVIQKLFKEFRDRGVKMKLVWNAGAAYGAATVDCTGAIAGYPVAIEVKRFDGRNKVTARQLADLREFRDAGAMTMVVDSEDALAHLAAFLRYAARVPATAPDVDWSIGL